MANEDKATRYHRLQRRASLLATISAAVLLLLLLVTGVSAAIREAVARTTGGAFVITVLGYVAIVFLLHELLQLPFAYYQGVVLERRYELSTETRQHWWLNHLKAAAIGLAFAAAGGTLVMALIRWSADWWWVAAAVAFIVILVGMAQLAPVLLLPLFYDFTPLQRPE